MTAQQPLTIMPRTLSLQAKLRLGLLAAGVGGAAVWLGSELTWMVWARVDPPVMLFDPRQDLCRAIGRWGFVLMAAGICGLAFVHGDAGLRSRLSRYGGALFWGCAGALLALSQASAYARLSIAELQQTLLGSGLIGGLLLGVAAILAALVLDLAGRIAKARAG